MRISLLIFITSIQCLTLAASYKHINPQEYNSHNGIKITAETISTICEPIPYDIAQSAYTWLNNNPGFIDLMNISQDFDPDSISKRMRSYYIALDQMKNENRQTFSHNFMVVPSRIVNKVRALISSLYLNPTDHINYKQLPISNPTYQNISVACHYHLLKRAIATHNLTHIHVPETYLLPFSRVQGYQQTPCTDTNHIIVQQSADQYVNIESPQHCISKGEIVQSFTDNTLKELHTAITKAILWDSARQLCVNPTNTNDICYKNIESPFRNNTQRFFYQKDPTHQGNPIYQEDRESIAKDIAWGLDNIYFLLKAHGTTEQLRTWSSQTNAWNGIEEIHD